MIILITQTQDEYVTVNLVLFSDHEIQMDLLTSRK